MTDKKRLLLGVIFSFVLIFIGGTYAYWNWQSAEGQKTNVTFTATAEFSCSADGDGTLELTSSDVVMAPSSCTNSNHVIKRNVKVNADLFVENSSVYMDLWLNIEKLDKELSESQNFRYALTTSETSCNEGVVASGTFNRKSVGDKVNILGREFSETGADNYYLYIWLDSAETDVATANKNFKFQLDGTCANNMSIIDPERPVLDGTGLIPITISDSGVVKTINPTSSDWYNYSNKKWANAVLVKSSSRSRYRDSGAGMTVNESDILAYYVWIPRFKYKIWTTGVSSTGSEQTIDIVFERKETDFATGTTVGSYRTHPAFWWDGDSDGVMDSEEKLAGIWVGKFETTGTVTQPTIKYQLSALKSQTVGGQFVSSLIFSGGTLDSSTGLVTHQYNDVYGLDGSVDSHMMKNSEWGAVSYLSQSIYGINAQLNGSAGCSGTATGNCMFTSSNLKKISTTDNTTGVFDTANSNSERVMGNWNKTFGSSGFSYAPAGKYYDAYLFSDVNSCMLDTCGGHALSETSGWYSGDSAFVGGAPYWWFVRGKNSSQFSFNKSIGTTTGYSWRSVLVNVPSYIISYSANGGSGAPDNLIKMYGGRALISSTVPTRAGYEFLGWNTEKDGSGDSYNSGDVYTANAGATLYAQWSGSPVVNISSTTNDVADRQTVVFNVSDEVGVVEYYVGKINPNNAEVVWKTIESTTNKDLTAVVDDGGTWYFAARDKDGNVSSAKESFYRTDLVVSNATVSPKYIILPRWVEFTIPTPTVKSGYTFNGWYTNSDYSGNAITTSISFNNDSLYGKVDENVLSISSGVSISGNNMVDETLSVDLNLVTDLTRDDYTISYQWYYNSKNSTTGGIAIKGATASTYKIQNALVNKYVYVVVTFKADNYLDQVLVDITDSTNGSSTVDALPIVKISSTANVNAKNQTATLTCSDNDGIVQYAYVEPSKEVEWQSVGTITANFIQQKNVLKNGTYYLYCKDTTGNVSSFSITYYEYSIHHMLRINGNGGAYNTDNYKDLFSSDEDNYVIPAASMVDPTNIYTIPVGSTATRLLGWSDNDNPAVLNAMDLVQTIPITGNMQFYYWFTPNVLYINYSTNGGIIEPIPSVNGNWTTVGDIVYLNGIMRSSNVWYGFEFDFLNYNNSTDMNITKTGYGTIDGKEWICLKGCDVGTTYDQNAIYTSEDVCDISTDDCNVVVGVNWVPNEYTITYDTNGGSGVIGPMTCTYDAPCTLTANTFTRVGYTFNGWNTSADGSGISYEDEYDFLDSENNSKYNVAEDLVLYAQWTPNTYIIMYDSNGGTGAMESLYCTYDDNCTLFSNTFTKAGYTFVGWNTASDGSGTSYTKDYVFSPYNVASDLRLYAVWEQNPIRVYYNVNNGAISGNYSSDEDGFIMLDGSLFYQELMDAGSPLHLDDFVITKSGYSYVYENAWNTASDGSGNTFTSMYSYFYDALIDFTIDAGSYYRLNLYVNWTPNTYTITYNSNGGTGTMASTACTYGQYCVLSANAFTRLGYTFLYWYGSDGLNYTESKAFLYDLADDLTLSARWGASSYGISYELNGGSVGTNAPTIRSYDSVFNISKPTKTITVTGDANGTSATIGEDTSGIQTFAGWTFDGNIDTAMYGATSSTVTNSWSSTDTLVTAEYFKNLDFPGPVTLTAHWTPVSFNLPTIVQTGYSCHWNTSADGSGTSYASGATYTPVNQDNGPTVVTMYAICEINKYTVSYDANGGTDAPAPQVKTYAETLTLSNDKPTKAGYTFLGWYPDDASATSATYASGGTYTENESVTLYAVWRPNKVFINFNVNGGSITTPTTSSDGSTTYNWTVDTNGTLYVNGNLETNFITYGNTLSGSGLTDYNNRNYLYLNSGISGVTANSGEEWVCLSGCTVDGKVFSQSITTYTSSDFCDASNGDCTVELGVNWLDTELPSCELMFTYNGGIRIVSFKYKDDNIGVTEFGLSHDDLVPVYNGLSYIESYNHVSVYGYVKDAAGNSSMCMCDLSDVTEGGAGGGEWGDDGGFGD